MSCTLLQAFHTPLSMVGRLRSVFATYFALMELNPLISARSGPCYRKGAGWKFSINGSRVHLPDNLFFLCLRMRGCQPLRLAG